MYIRKLELRRMASIIENNVQNTVDSGKESRKRKQSEIGSMISLDTNNSIGKYKMEMIIKPKDKMQNRPYNAYRHQRDFMHRTYIKKKVNSNLSSRQVLYMNKKINLLNDKKFNMPFSEKGFIANKDMNKEKGMANEINTDFKCVENREISEGERIHESIYADNVYKRDTAIHFLNDSIRKKSKLYRDTVSEKDLKLFLYFIRSVNDTQPQIMIENNSNIPMYYKYRRDNINDTLCLVSESSAFGSDGNEMYICGYCTMKYVYKRCLINHIKSKHKK